MINDGYWRYELFIRRHIIRFWSLINRLCYSKRNEHRVSKEILFTAVIVRKIIEDDKEIRAVSRKNKWEEPPLETMKYRIPVWQLPYIGEADPIGYNFVASDYDYESAKNVQYDLSIMCNKIIHSNIWSIVYDGRKRMDSIAFSSDKEKAKESYVIELKDWLNMLQFVSNNAAV